MPKWRNSTILISVIAGVVILTAALFVMLPRLGGPPPAPTLVAPLPAAPTLPTTAAPTDTTETRPTLSVTHAATLTALPASATVAAYPAPVQTEPSAPALTSTALPTGTVAGQLAPDFNLMRENGGRVRLGDYRGKQTVVLVFFRGQT